jgi:hypothetical protein
MSEVQKALISEQIQLVYVSSEGAISHIVKPWQHTGSDAS